MDKSTQDNLCVGLRACGIPKKMAHNIMNIVVKWARESGVEWCVDRIKALRQWYESTLAGNPTPPVWFRHSADGYPLGVWKQVFDLPKAKALGVLSLDTVFYEHHVSRRQEEKFFHGLAGNGQPVSIERVRQEFFEAWERREANIPGYRDAPATSVFTSMPEMTVPTPFDMTKSCPVEGGTRTIRPENHLGVATVALARSWEDIPQGTFDFLVDSQDRLDWIPIAVAGNDYQLELDRPHTKAVGRIGVTQEPELKARFFANPNRITQVTLDPLKVLYMETARAQSADCTHNQEEGLRWVRDELRAHRRLAGFDLTSASDLLSLECSLELCALRYGFRAVDGYMDHEKYLKDICRGRWYYPPGDTYVKWEQGFPLGFGPTFGLLTLTNCAVAEIAVFKAKNDGLLKEVYDPQEAFRVLGDDIIIRAEAGKYYADLIQSMGGEINMSKTLESDQVAEFAGRVVTREGVYLKKVKYSEPSDNSFMSYVSQMGPQSVGLLRTRQRRTYEQFKYVPGVVVDGPWSPDSHGEPLAVRYQWYLEEVFPALEREEPDLIPTTLDMALLKGCLSAAELGQEIDRDHELPWPITEDYLSSELVATYRVGGDPRALQGLTLEQALSRLIQEGRVRPFRDWLQDVDEPKVIRKEPEADRDDR